MIKIIWITLLRMIYDAINTLGTNECSILKPLCSIHTRAVPHSSKYVENLNRNKETFRNMVFPL